MVVRCREWVSALQITVEPIFFIFTLSNSLASPTDSALVYDKACANLFSSEICGNLDNETYAKEEAATQTLASKYTFYMNIVSTIPSLITTIIYGSWSDRFSRKYVILLPVVGRILFLCNHLIGLFIFNKF